MLVRFIGRNETQNQFSVCGCWEQPEATGFGISNLQCTLPRLSGTHIVYVFFLFKTHFFHFFSS